MRKADSSNTILNKKIMTEEQRKTVISKANVVKEDIDQLLMYVGANNDVNAIAQKMAQLGQDLADLDSYFCNCRGKRSPARRRPRQVSAKTRHGAMLN